MGDSLVAKSWSGQTPHQKFSPSSKTTTPLLTGRNLQQQSSPLLVLWAMNADTASVELHWISCVDPVVVMTSYSSFTALGPANASPVSIGHRKAPPFAFDFCHMSMWPPSPFGCSSLASHNGKNHHYSAGVSCNVYFCERKDLYQEGTGAVILCFTEKAVVSQ